MRSLLLHRYKRGVGIQEIPLIGDVARLGNTNEINDGGYDMYDGGNRLHTNLSPSIPYTHSQANQDFPKDGIIVNGNAYFGSGSQYFTNMYPGMFVLGVTGANISSFSIEGNNGADGGGSVEAGQFSQSGWKCFYKTVGGAGDPTINHMIFVFGDGSGITHDYSMNTDDDHDMISGSIPPHLYYLLVANRGGPRLSESDLQAVAASFLGKINKNSLSASLSNLNSGFADVVAIVPNSYVFADDGFGETGLTYPQAAVCLSENEFFVADGDNGNLYKVTISGGEGIVEQWKSNLYYFQAMARLNDKIYAINGPFLAIMDLDGNVLNEVEDHKFSIFTSVFLNSLFTKNGVLYGTSNENVYTVNVETGECVFHKSGIFDGYVDTAGV